MVRPGRERLSGRVEVDETYVGGAEEGLRGRQTQKKALLAIAAEEDGAGIGRIRMKRIRGASKQQLHGFIQEAVEPDSTIHTDGWEGYVGLEALGYRHEYDFLAGSSQSALRAVAPRSPGGCPVEALVDRDAPRRCEP